MRRPALLLVAMSMLLSSCGVSNSLYYWGGSRNGTTTYEALAYRFYDRQTPESICQLVCAYEDMVSHPGGSRNVPPPGICAEYGYLLLQPQTAETFAAHATAAQRRIFQGTAYKDLFRERGEEMLAREMEYYPESATFISPILRKLTGKGE